MRKLIFQCGPVASLRRLRGRGYSIAVAEGTSVSLLADIGSMSKFLVGLTLNQGAHSQKGNNMEKISLLSRQSHADGRRGKGTPTSSEQAARLTHTIMNQLTVIYLSCAKLRRSLGTSSLGEDCELRIIESAVEKIAKQAETLRFRLEKTNPSKLKPGAETVHKQLGSKTKV